MDQMQFHCQLVMLRLDDMQDLVLMIDGKFKKRSNFFDLSKLFKKLDKMMMIKASIKNVDIKFDTNSSMDLSDRTTLNEI